MLVQRVGNVSRLEMLLQRVGDVSTAGRKCHYSKSEMYSG